MISSLLLHVTSTLKTVFICPLFKKGGKANIAFSVSQTSTWGSLNRGLFSAGGGAAGSSLEAAGSLRRPSGPGLHYPRLSSCDCQMHRELEGVREDCPRSATPPNDHINFLSRVLAMFKDLTTAKVTGITGEVVPDNAQDFLLLNTHLSD